MTRLTALYAFLESSFFAPSQVLDQLSALQQRGRSHREDSLLFRHLNAGTQPLEFF